MFIDGSHILSGCPWVMKPGKYQGGAVAQLGARLNGIQKVRGSTPLSSTNIFKAKPVLLINCNLEIV